MRLMPYLIQHPSGIYYAQREIPERLQTVVPLVLKNGRDRQVYLKRSLGTTVLSQANISIKPVLIEFDRIIREAEALENSRPPARATLSAAEIERMAEYIYGKALQWDERIRAGGRDELRRMFATIRKEAVAEGEDPAEIKPAYSYETLPPYGLSAEQLAENREQLAGDLRAMREALALGNRAAVQDQMADALDTFGINLHPKSTSHPALGLAVLRAYVRALEAIEKRNAGLPVETPVLPRGPLSTPVPGGGTLREAFEGWNKVRERPDDTVTEYRRAVEMFIQLHGNLAVAEIKRKHALEFRDEIRLVPRRRSERAPFVTSELQVVFDAPLFTSHEWPVGARGAAGVWLPLLSLFTGARQSELAGLNASNITEDEATGTWLMYIVSDRKTGRRLKTKPSERVIPTRQGVEYPVAVVRSARTLVQQDLAAGRD
jgi:hypothetical protein